MKSYSERVLVAHLHLNAQFLYWRGKKSVSEIELWKPREFHRHKNFTRKSITFVWSILYIAEIWKIWTVWNSARLRTITNPLCSLLTVLWICIRYIFYFWLRHAKDFALLSIQNDACSLTATWRQCFLHRSDKFSNANIVYIAWPQNLLQTDEVDAHLCQ